MRSFALFCFSSLLVPVTYGDIIANDAGTYSISTPNTTISNGTTLNVNNISTSLGGFTQTQSFDFRTNGGTDLGQFDFVFSGSSLSLTVDLLIDLGTQIPLTWQFDGIDLDNGVLGEVNFVNGTAGVSVTEQTVLDSDSIRISTSNAGSPGTYTYNFAITAVPEPSHACLLGLAFLMFGWRHHSRRVARAFCS